MGAFSIWLQLGRVAQDSPGTWAPRTDASQPLLHHQQMAAPQSSLRGGGGLQFEEEETQIWGRKGFETLGETEPVETQEGGLKVAIKE